MQDIFNSRDCNQAIFMTSAQVGKTEILKNIILYSIAKESGGTTFMLPSESIAKDYSKAQIAPLVRDTKISFAYLIGNTRQVLCNDAKFIYSSQIFYAGFYIEEVKC